MSWLPNWLTGYDQANADAASAADARLQQLNAERYANDERLAAIVAANRERELYGTNDGSYGGIGAYDARAQTEDIQNAFQTELDARAKSLIGSPLDGLGALLKSILKALPMWLWIALGLGLFVWLGGLTWLRGILGRGFEYGGKE
jgi:hypothetical protein